MGEYFAYITGVVTIVAFVIQIRDIFPKYREETKSALYIAFGVFLGTLITFFDKVQVKTQVDLHPVQVILIALLVILLISGVLILFSAVLCQDPRKRDEFYGVAGALVIVFFVSLVATGFSFLPGPVQREPEFTEQELIAAINHNVSINDYARALSMLKQLRSRFPQGDPRRSQVDNRIEEIKKRMANTLNLDNK